MAIVYPLAWPARANGGLLVPTQVDLHLATLSKSGGQTLLGSERVVVSPAARWMGKLTLPNMQPADLLMWRGFVAAMQGRVGSVLVPAFEAGRQPWPLDARGRPQTPSLARNPLLRSSGFAVDATQDAKANILVIAAAAAINATTISLQATQAGPIMAGHRFSIGDTLYEIMQSTTGGAGIYTATIRPWLRAAIGAGTVCQFRASTCRMRFASDDEGNLDLDSGRFSHPVVNLVEDI